LAIVLPIGDQKKGEGLCEFYKGPFWKKKGGPNCQISRKKNLNLPYLDNKVQAHWQNMIRIFILFFLKSSMTHSKIWLSPLVDDHQPTTYLTKLDQKKPCIVSYQRKQGFFLLVKKNVKLKNIHEPSYNVFKNNSKLKQFK
jgi:hypothetical protein